ncbi:unnamed protein product, partial [Iphiclides podalirius]
MQRLSHEWGGRCDAKYEGSRHRGDVYGAMEEFTIDAITCAACSHTADARRPLKRSGEHQQRWYVSDCAREACAPPTTTKPMRSETNVQADDSPK